MTAPTYTNTWQISECTTLIHFTLTPITHQAPHGILTAQLFKKAVDGTPQFQGIVKEADITVESFKLNDQMRGQPQVSRPMTQYFYHQKQEFIGPSLSDRKVDIIQPDLEKPQFNLILRTLR